MLQYGIYTLSPKTIPLIKVWKWIMAANIPIFFDFVSKKPAPYVLPYETVKDPSYGRWPKPLYSYEVVAFDARQPCEFDPTHGSVGLCWPGEHKISVAYYGYESDKDMGARIYHELLHSEGIDSDQMEARDFDAFHAYLMKTDPNWLNVITRTGHPKYVDLLIVYYNWLFYNHNPKLSAYSTFDKLALWWVRIREILKSSR